MALLLIVSVALGQNCVNREPATMVYGQLGSFTTGTFNNGGISAISLATPEGVAVDSAGNLYIIDAFNSRVLVYAPGSSSAFRVYGQLGSFTTGNKGGISSSSLGFLPGGVAVDSMSNVYVADTPNERVVVYAPGSNTAFRVFGQLGSFTTRVFNNGGISADSLSAPEGVAVDSTGNVFVADTKNHRVLMYAPGSTTAFRVYGQLGSFTTNAQNNGGVTSASLSFPQEVAVDSAGNVFIVDGNSRVLVYASGSTTAFRVYGQLGSFTFNAGNNGGLSANSLVTPAGVAFDGAGNVYVVDKGNNRVLVYAPGSTTAFRVYGQLGSFTSGAQNNGGLSGNSLSSPQGVAIDSAGNVYLADTSNNRVLGELCYCLANFVSASGRGPCAPCPAGADAVTLGSVNCSSCASGFFNPTPGQACQACPAGSFSNSVKGSTGCTLCPAGADAPSASFNCSSCVVGFFNPTPGHACQACPAGSFSNSVQGSTRCTPCPAGSYIASSGALLSSCIPCPEGTASNAVGASSPLACQPCPSGSAIGIGSTSCLVSSNSTGGLPLGGIVGV
jgi:sugar lactone lactonase YvrE